AAVIRPDVPPEKAAYTAIYVKQDGKWLLDRVTEGEVLTAPEKDEPLQQLDWLIGSWIDQDDKNRIETTYAWTKNESFITCFFTVSVEERVEMSGLQIIGWDPAEKKIRSWVFDSEGGFGEGTWSEKDQRFSIQLKGTLSDGRKSSSVIIITHVDDDTCT